MKLTGRSNASNSTWPSPARSEIGAAKATPSAIWATPTPTSARPGKRSTCTSRDLAIRRELSDRRGEGNALGNLGTAYADLGETRQAIELYEQRLEVAREIGDRRGEANTSWNLGAAYEKLGEIARAVDCMQACVDFEREVGHPDAEKDAAHVEELRAPVTPPNSR
ncbi:MAG TPA: tetratricopeptide repeat protein [Thermoanaerobaculia bacterium]|nr:tetratricopeptide repeat protein [Thermoanaerobaculia bacterium]